MKKFISNMALMCLLVVVSLGAIATVNKQYLDKDNYLYEFPVKQQLIRNTPSPKIVFLGGSNVAFGLDCKAISDSLHLPVINAGLHAGLGLWFIMDNNIRLLRKGDILVIMPEYDHFTSNANGESQTCGMIPYFASTAEMKHLNWEQSQNVIKGFGRVTMISFVDGCKNLIRRKNADKYLYKKSGFNAVGDEVSHLSLPSDVDMHYFTPSGMEASLDNTYLDEFAAEVRRLENKGIKVLLLPPAIYEAGYNLKTAAIAKVASALSDRGIPFRADTKNFAYPVDMMYNTEYHINKLGVKANTQNILEVLHKLIRH